VASRTGRPSIAFVTHYEVLGVAASASAAEIRRAFVDAARRAHPDFHTEADTATRAGAEERMRCVNQAWAVLGDADRRRDYDRVLAEGERAERLAERRNHRPGTPSPDFVPYVDDDTDYAALLDDLPAGNGARVPRAVQLAPVVLLALAGFALSAGLVASFGPLLALGVVLLVLSGLSFLFTTAFAVMRSLESDRD
jgi:hypothetical protein